MRMRNNNSFLFRRPLKTLSLPEKVINYSLSDEHCVFSAAIKKYSHCDRYLNTCNVNLVFTIQFDSEEISNKKLVRITIVFQIYKAIASSLLKAVTQKNTINITPFTHYNLPCSYEKQHTKGNIK